MREADRWLRQRERDLISARDSCRPSNFEWACFQVQQSADKVLKALDSAYIMVHYPDSIVGSLTPAEYYDKEDAEECIEYVGSICNAARRALSL